MPHQMIRKSFMELWGSRKVKVSAIYSYCVISNWTSFLLLGTTTIWWRFTNQEKIDTIGVSCPVCTERRSKSVFSDMNRCTAHIVALCSVKFQLNLISHQQDELCNNFYSFLHNLMNSRCIADTHVSLRRQSVSCLEYSMSAVAEKQKKYWTIRKKDWVSEILSRKKHFE